MNKPKTTAAAASRKPRKTLEAYLAAFAANMDSATTHILEASRQYVAAIEDYGDAALPAFRARFPGVTQATFDRLRTIGMGDVRPEVLYLTGPVAARVARLPYAEQGKVLGGHGCKFSVVTGSGETVVRHLANLSPAEEKTLFDERGRRRTLAQQREYLAARVRLNPASRPYRIDGAWLVVNRACRIGRAELGEILRRMG